MTSPDRTAMEDDLTALSVTSLLRLRERAFQSAGSGIVITDASQPHNPVIDVNPAFERITGHRRADVLGQNPRMLQSPRTDPAAIEEIRAGIAAQREVNVTILNRHRDGTPFWNDLLIAPVFASDGQLTHFVGIQTDITARKLAEERTRFLASVSDQLGVSLDYRAALAGAVELAVPLIADLFLVDLIAEGEGVDRVAATFAGLEDRGRAGLLLDWTVQPEDSHGAALALRTGQSQFIPSVAGEDLPSLSRDADALRRRTGAEVLSYLTVPLIARRRILGALTIATTSISGRGLETADLDLMREFARRAAMAIDNALLYREARLAVRARDQFLSIAAHELRTPVSSIKGYAQMLLRAQRKGEVPVERLKRSLETIDSSTDRLTLLTSDLLDVSRIRLGQLPLRPGEIDFAAKVCSVVQRFEESAADTHRIDVIVAPGNYLVRADSDRMDQVLTNLLENAAKYSPDSDRIALSLWAGDEQVRLAVNDFGIGLPPGGERGIFEPFERAANALKHELPGLGLGLYICRGLIERHGGEIWAESAGEGLGTTFHVAIPTLGHGPDLNADHAIPLTFE